MSPPTAASSEDSLPSQDAGIAVDNARMIKSTVDAFGGLDIIVANAGWTKFEKFGDLGAMSNEEWDRV